ncbi:acetylxylan esterase [Pseudopedobacter beijingensis]|uniref:Acetylxylan esterase n=1 Tax=Pseudopedobacter beijingensis TaxID=1207056 RepID=A0ABW4I6E1_9SPHI
MAVFLASKAAEISIKIHANKESRVYNIGEEVSFAVVVEKDGNLIDGLKVEYLLGREGINHYQKGERKLVNGKTLIVAKPLTIPGFLKCELNIEYEGKIYREIAVVGFSPDKILSTSVEPKDFMAFWKKELNGLEKIPLNPKLELLKDRSTASVNVYHVNFQNEAMGSKIYGILCLPKKEGKYPAVVRFPGAGIRPHWGNIELAEKGVITLAIGIHGIPVNMDSVVYSDLYKGALRKYPEFKLESKDDYYFKRVYLGSKRALDFIYTLAQFDGHTLAVTGVSQGGALSIVTAALDPRVKFVLAYCPALAELTGFIHNRAAGWPHLFNHANQHLAASKDYIKTAAYYDVVNFAKYVRASGYYSWGFNDEITPATSIYSMYNIIQGPKKIFIDPEVSHTVSALQAKNGNTWLEEMLKIR